MTGPLQTQFRMFALYNRWANRQLYGAAARLAPLRLADDRGAFFGSLLGTLNHLIVTDRLWMGRLEGHSARDVKLDEILYPAFASLAEARAGEDARIIGHVFALDEEAMAATLNYETSSGAPQSQPRCEVLSHLFNHQTHHRGQAHDLLCQIAGRNAAPVLDLLAYQRTAAPTDKP